MFFNLIDNLIVEGNGGAKVSKTHPDYQDFLTFWAQNGAKSIKNGLKSHDFGPFLKKSGG